MSREKEDMYDLLCLEFGADRAEVEQAYRHLALKYHPDNQLDSKNPEKFKEVTSAYRSICLGIKQNKREDCDLKLFLDHCEHGLLSALSERGVYPFFVPGSLGASCDEMYIDDDDDLDSGEKQFDVFVDIVQNSRQKGIKVPEGLNDEKLAEVREALIDERETIKRDSKKQGVSKTKTPSQVPVSKPKPKSKKQKAAEQRRREQEMEKIADELAKTQKLEEEKAKRKEQAEQKKQEEERSRLAAEEKKRKEREEKERLAREKREKEELEARLREEERQREKEEKRRKATEAKQKQLAEQKAKEEEEKKKKEAAAKITKQQQQQQQDKNYPPREVPPRFASKQQHKQQQSPPAVQRSTAVNNSSSSTTCSESKMMNQANQQKKQNGNASWVSSTSWGGSDEWSRGNSTGSGWNEPLEAETHQQRDSPALDGWSGSASSNWAAPPKASNEIIVDSKDKQAWPSINDQSEQEDNDNASVKSGSVISSSSGHEQTGSVTPHSASGEWGGSAAESWHNNSSSPRAVSSAGWGSTPNQGLNMQTGPNPAGGDNASNPLAAGWAANSVAGLSTGLAAGRPLNSMQRSAQGGDAGSGMWGKPAGWSSNTPSEKEWGAGDATSGWGAPSPPDSSLNSGGWGNPSHNPSPNPTSSGWGQPTPAPTSSASGWGGAKSQSGATNDRGTAPSQWGAPSPTATTSQASSWGSTAPSAPQGQWGAKPADAAGANDSQAKPPQQPSTFAQAAGKGLKPAMPSPAEQARLQQEMERKRAISSLDGWGSNGVRQDTPWAAAESPETKRKIDDPTVWNHTANTGTAIWEQTKKPTSGVITAPHSDWDAPEPDDPKVWRNPEPVEAPVWSERREHKSSTSSWGEPPPVPSPQPLANNPSVWGSAPAKPMAPTGSWGPPPVTTEAPPPMWGGGGGGGGGMRDVKPSDVGWEDPPTGSEGNARVDDGTAVWGNPDVKTQPPPPTWNPNAPPASMAPSGVGPRSADEMWNKPRWADVGPGGPVGKMDGMSSMWDSGPGQRGPGSWGDSKPKTPSLGSWGNDADMARKMGGGDGDNDWDTSIGEWNPADINSSWSSKSGFKHMEQRRTTNSAMPIRPQMGPNQPHMRSRMVQLLMDMGVSKERASAAIISNNMNFDKAVDELKQTGALRDDLMPPSEMGQFRPPPFSADNNLSSAQYSATRNLGSSLAPPSINNKQQGLRPGPQPGLGQGTAIRGPGGNQSQLSQQQMARQLQVAIQAGLINPQILSQQLSWPLLVLLQGFLQSYTNERQLTSLSQQIVQQNKSGYPNARIQFDQVQQQLKAERQKMAQFQQQIARATAMNPPMSSVQKDLNNMTIGDSNPKPPKSRLTDWLQPADKEEADFVKAPGKPSLHQSHSTPNLNPEKNDDSTWGLSAPSGRDWSAQSAMNSAGGSKETESPPTTSSSISDIPEIPEFVPGQPWPGLVTKSVEEDPTITPGSVLSSRTSLNTIDSNHLSSLASRSTTADVKTVNSSASTGRSLSMSSSITSDLWGAPSKANSIQSSRPPPGLGGHKSGWGGGGGGNANSGSGVGFNRSVSWAPGDRSAQQSMPPFGGGGGGGGGFMDGRSVPCWLILKNLTSQIDENTLRALCSQHGPLLSFINIPSSGQAIVQYSTQEQALRAQKSLNMCMLGNNAMLVDFASEDDVTRLMIQQQARGPPPPSHNLWSGGGGHSSHSSHSHQPPRSAGPYQRGGQWGSGNSGSAGGMWGGVGGGSLWGPSSNFDDSQGMNLIPPGLLGESM